MIRNIAEELDPTFRAPGPGDPTLKTGPAGTEWDSVGNNEVESYTVKQIVSLIGLNKDEVLYVLNVKVADWLRI